MEAKLFDAPNKLAKPKVCIAATEDRQDDCFRKSRRDKPLFLYAIEASLYFLLNIAATCEGHNVQSPDRINCSLHCTAVRLRINRYSIIDVKGQAV